MRRQTLKAIPYLLFLLILTACSQGDGARNGGSDASQNAASSGGPADPSNKKVPGDVVRVEAGKTLIKTGGSAEAMVTLKIAEGYHINSNPASFSYLIPTEVQLQPNNGISADKPVYPPSLTKTFAFSKEPLAVYEGEISIKIPIRAETKASKGDSKLGARVRVQPCDDTTCYPPRTIETSIPVTVD